VRVWSLYAEWSVKVRISGDSALNSMEQASIGSMNRQTSWEPNFFISKCAYFCYHVVM
jgi:hypothetical protein